jgi:RNA polymerase-binding transcription factor DksA
MLDQKKLGQLRQRLLRRLDEVRADIRRELRKYDNEKYGELADRVADAGEQSVADLLVDLDLAEVDLLRLADGSYGSCVDCEEPIDAQRLENSPAVSRCYGCQQRFEHRDREIHHRTL